MLFGYNCYYYILVFLKNKKKELFNNKKFLEDFYQEVDERSLPLVTIQLPIFNEKYVVKRLVDAVCQMDYPKDKYEIQVLDDSNDETVDLIDELVGHYKKKGFDIVHITREDRIDFKAGALQLGLRVSKGEYLAIFDSDFVPPMDFLKKTVPFMIKDDGLALVQTRWGHLNPNSSLLTRAQSIGIDGHFIIEQAARSWGNMFLNFNGTAGIWKKKAIEDAGGWHGDTLTEDMDLSYRAQLKGWKTKFLYEVVCKAELPENINAFKSQQYRWAKGSIQTAKKILPSVFKSSFSLKKKFQSILHLTHYIIHPCMLAMAIMAFPIIWLIEIKLSPGFAFAILLILVGSLLAPSTMYIVSQWREYRDWKWRITTIPFLICVGVGVAVNNTFAVFSALFGAKGAFIRTPKTGNMDNQIKKNRSFYKIKFDKIFLLELALSFYCFFSFFIYIQAEKYFIGPFLFIYALSFLLSSSLSMKHQFRNINT
ncbi:MAG: glycosyltransferase family 2 protein [Gammaproteobacteria bacterium]|nr:glycosyltransferase family 2 protein [Gammaproteobacteria bacterium]